MTVFNAETMGGVAHKPISKKETGKPQRDSWGVSSGKPDGNKTGVHQKERIVVVNGKLKIVKQ